MKIKFPLLIEPFGVTEVAKARSREKIVGLLSEFYTTPIRREVRCTAGFPHDVYEISEAAFFAILSNTDFQKVGREFYVYGPKNRVERVPFEAFLQKYGIESLCESCAQEVPKTLAQEFYGTDYGTEDGSANVVFYDRSPFPFGGVKQRKPPKLAKPKSRRGR